MRTFQLLFIVIFLVIYSLISFGALSGLLKITSTANNKKVSWSIFVYSALILVCFVLLYIWPITTRNTKDYTFHLIFNVLLSADFVFKIPLAFSFVIGFLFSQKRKSIVYTMGLILSIGISSSVIFGFVFGTKSLVINNVELEFPNLPQHYDGLKLMQISDIHLGNFLQSKKLMLKVQSETEKINPDIILFTGDLVNNFSDELIGWNGIFKHITKNKICFSILGNHDYGNYTRWDSEAEKIENFNQIVSGNEAFGFRLLNNEHVKLKSNTDSIYIVGVENWGHPPFPQYANIEKAVAGIPKDAFKILMTHDPAHWDEVIKYRGDFGFTISGHTHGMQWGIMRAGITFSLIYFTRQNWGGLYNYNNSYLYVNTGLGTVGIPWRINMPAEITVFT
jgi:predicted MPP superfamily phosphohydrolase